MASSFSFSINRNFLRLLPAVVALVSVACDCGGARTGLTSVGVTLVTPEGHPEEFERTVDWGRVRAGELQTQRILLRNDGRARARITKAELVGTSDVFFLAGAAVLPELDITDTFEMELRFLPFEIGSYEATVVVETNVPETERYTIHFRARAVVSRIDVCTRVEGREVCASEDDDGELLIDLGLVRPGDESRRPLIIRNRGDGDLNVTDIRPTESTSVEFSVAPDEGPVEVGPDSSVEYEVVYQPLDGGLDEGEILLLTDDPEAREVLVKVRAEGNAPRICVKPSHVLDFGEQDVGTEVTQVLTLESCGRESVSISNFVFFAGDRDHFSIAGFPEVPLTLQPGESVDLDVSYAPELMGEDLDGRLTVFSSSPGQERGTIPIRGNAVGCDIVASPSPVNFGDLSTNGQSTRTVVLSNRGTGSCRVTEFLEPASPFSLETVPEVPHVIEAGHQSTFVVGFAPSSTGQAEGQAILLVNVPDGGELVVPLRGRGITPPPCDLHANPDSLVFVGVDTGGSATQQVELRNFGTSTCTIVSGGIKDGSSLAFSASVSGFPPSEVRAGGTFNVPVKFEPSTSGTHTGALLIEYGDDSSTCLPIIGCIGGSAKKLEVPLEGRTLAPKLCLTPGELVFGDVNPGTQVERTFTISSCGQGALGLRGIAMAMGSSNAFVLGPRPTLPQYLAPGRSVQMRVLYRPRHGGGDFGAVDVLTNDPDHPEARVRLRGNADEVCPRQLACNQQKLTFATVDVGRSTSLSVTCQAVGSEPVTVDRLSFATGTSPEFTVFGGQLPRVVRPGDAMRVEVTYVPQDIGTDNGAIDFDSDSCTPVRVELEAAGRQPNYPRCPPPQVFQPVELWEWPKSGTVVRQSQNVGMSPVVINLNDDNGDGRIDEEDIPDVIFTSCRAGECCINCTPTGGGGFEKMDNSGKGMLRAARGEDGRDLWSVTDTSLMLTAMAQISAADIDGDNIPEIIAVKHHFKEGTGDFGMEGKYETGTLLVFDNEGKLKFETEPWIGSKDTIEQIGAPTLGDLDNDGNPEIFFESTVFNSRGTVIFHMPEWGNDGHGSMVSLVDLDGDGVLEIVAGRTVYRADGTRYWQSRLANGPTMVLDVDGDGLPEVILRDRPDRLHVLNGQTGAVKAGPLTWPMPTDSEGNQEGICSASMAAADLDGDGRPDIIVPSGDKLLAIKVNGSSLVKMWEAPILDYGGQCGASGAAAFDFEGDGKYEVVYHDTQGMFVYRGTNGQRIYQSPRNSSTLFETPVIADVNNDGHANLVMTNENGILGIGGHAGIKVLSNVGNNWPGTRRIWNQHTYHISDVNENGTIPRVEMPHYKSSNSWRAQQPLCTP